MMGPGHKSVDIEGKRYYDDDKVPIESEKIPKGIFLLAAEDIFKLLEGREQELGVILSFYEIYCGKLYDLLNTVIVRNARPSPTLRARCAPRVGQ